MSSFACEHCGAGCFDSPEGYITGCEHYPPDINVTEEWRRTNMEPTVLSLATDLIEKWESCRLKAYLCPAGVWTIGWGRTAGVRPGDTCTQIQADAWSDEDVREPLDAVLRLTSGTPSTKHQHAAMVCLAYNIGVSAYGSSSVLRRHRIRNYPSAADAFLMWNKITVNGKKVVSNGLNNRRADERALYLKDLI